MRTQHLRKEKVMETDQNHRRTRRGMLHVGSAALAGVSALAIANAQAERSPDHHLNNETVPGPKNPTLAAENPNSAWAPETDNGTAPPLKYSFALAHTRV